MHNNQLHSYLNTEETADIILDSKQKVFLKTILHHQLEPDFYGKKMLMALIPVEFVVWLENFVQNDCKGSLPRKFFKTFKKHTDLSMISIDEISELCHILGIEESNIVQKTKKWDQVQHFFCESCDHFFASKQVLARHNLKFHSSEEIYKFEICDKNFGSSTGLKRHFQTHQKSKLKINCNFCAASFSRNDSLLCHLRKFHKDVNAQNFVRPKRIRRLPAKFTTTTEKSPRKQ